MYPKPPVLELDATQPRACGQQHGETLRESIRVMADLRFGLMLKDTPFRSRDEVMALAEAHLQVLQDFDHALYEELLGIAEGSGLKPAEIVILNHYTDMRDINPRGLDLQVEQTPKDPGGCSVLYVPTPKGPLLGQTWDVHGTALDHVIMMHIRQPIDGDRAHPSSALFFSVAGCLGMTGMNALGLGVTINNLNSLDARVGVVWPALVRKLLRQSSAAKARDVVMGAPLGSGHHYVMADETEVFGIETSGTLKKITQTGADEIHLHTNHCLDAHMAKTHTIRPGSTTHQRYETLNHLVNEHAPTSAGEVYELLGRVSILKNEESPELTATCGALVMDLRTGRALACKGPPSEKLFFNPPLHLELKS